MIIQGSSNDQTLPFWYNIKAYKTTHDQTLFSWYDKVVLMIKPYLPDMTSITNHGQTIPSWYDKVAPMIKFYLPDTTR